MDTEFTIRRLCCAEMWTLTDVVETFQKFETHKLCAVCVHSDFSREDNVKYDLFNAVPSTRECVRDLKVSAPVCILKYIYYYVMKVLPTQTSPGRMDAV